MAEETKTTEQTKEETKPIEKKEEQKQEEKVDVEKVKSEALSNFMKEIGVEDKDALKGIIAKAKEEEDKNKTDLQKANDSLTEATKQLAEERKARLVAEAKVSAMQLGAKPELVEDLVIIAMTKVTKEKDINTVISEMKDSQTGKVYFAEKEEEEKEKGTVTRARVTKMSEKKETKKEEDNKDEKKHIGSMAERLLAGRKVKKKSSYFD